MNATLIGFIVYLAVVLVVGTLTYRLNETQADFLLAGRRLNVWVATFSERASGESAWLLLGLPAAAMVAGLVEIWTAIGSVTGIAFSWWVVAAGLRKETARLDALTIPEYFAKRFGDQATTIRLVATLIIIFFYAFYVAAQFNGAGKVLDVTFGIPKLWGIVIGAAVIAVYTMMGGFFAVAWTDLVQGILMIGTLVVLPIVAVAELAAQGGSIAATLDVHANAASWTGGKTGLAAFSAVIGGLSWGFGYSGQPHTLTRYMSIADHASIRRGRVIAMAWAIPAFIGALMIGLAGMGLYPAGTFDDPERLMPRMATDLLPAWLAGLFISGAIAAMMSTADSQLLVATSAVAEDVVHKGLGKELSPKGLVTLSRVVTLGMALAGFALAITIDELVFTMVSYAWSGLGSAFGPALILTLHDRRTTGRGVLWGMITGALTTIVWTNIDVLNDALTARVASFVLAAIAVIVGSRAGGRRR